MKGCAGFWIGMGAGLLTGAAMGMMWPYGRDPMKTQVGKSIQKLGIAVDHAVDNIITDMRLRKRGGISSALHFSHRRGVPPVKTGGTPAACCQTDGFFSFTAIQISH